MQKIQRDTEPPWESRDKRRPNIWYRSFFNRAKSTESGIKGHILLVYGNSLQHFMDYFNTNFSTNASSTLRELLSEEQMEINAPGSPKRKLNQSETTNRRQGSSNAMDVTDHVYHEPLTLSEFGG